MNHRNRIVTSNPLLAHILTEPYEILISAALATYGLLLLLTGKIPPSLEELEPHRIIVIWAALLVVSGYGAIWGMFRSKSVELAANIVLGALVTAYGVNVVIALGIAGAAGAAFALPIAAAMFLTARRIVIARRIARVIDDAQ